MTKPNFDAFRILLADKLVGCENKHVKNCENLLREVGFEPGSLFHVSCFPPHTLFEEFLEIESDFDEWFEFDAQQCFRDWLIDMHPGLCPQEVANEIDAHFAK